MRFIKVKNDFKIIKIADISYGVGKSASGNDQLRSKWANKDDYWFHLDGNKSSHVIVKLSGQQLSTEVINTAATLVAHFSQFKDEWIPIIFTQVKNLKGITGTPGMVIYKKEKHLSCPKIILDQSIKEGL